MLTVVSMLMSVPLAAPKVAFEVDWKRQHR
jgi:hypothetical protein